MSEREIRSLISSLTSICSLYQQIIADMAQALEFVVESETDSPMRDALVACRELTLERLKMVQRLVDIAHRDALRNFGISLKTPEVIH